ncbi:4044_t:CDS:2 [Ambispora leptoticha]|uniref:4044_t:CDS:1 n=1 Tax=Ambispora leptoticha TaxID=144679 RepID=A0A9N9DWL6_9GLOM|nr:4044_t:CDS:2 [Ambispora leptoticha]
MVDAIAAMRIASVNLPIVAIVQKKKKLSIRANVVINALALRMDRNASVVQSKIL